MFLPTVLVSVGLLGAQTGNPETTKQRRPAPTVPPQGGQPDTQSADVPHQEPGTENPDVSKQRKGDKVTPTEGEQQGSAKQPKGKRNQKKPSSTSSTS